MIEKVAYKAPTLTRIGSVGQVTLATSSGPNTDVVLNTEVVFGPDGPLVLS